MIRFNPSGFIRRFGFGAVPPVTRMRLPAAGRPSAPRKLLPRAHKRLPTAQRLLFFTWPSRQVSLHSHTGGFLAASKHALTRMATVLIIACPHALGLAIPLVIAISTSLGAHNGLLVKDRLALERARLLDMVIFDKTGTLTRGSPAITGVVAAPDIGESELIALASAVETNSEHSLARAVIAEADHRGVVRLQASDFQALPGRGAQR